MNPDQSLIERLLGGLGAAEAALLRPHQEALWAAEAAWLSLLAPARLGPVALHERQALAAFAALLQGEPGCASHYRGVVLGRAPGLAALLEDEALRAGRGPFRVSPGARARLGGRLAAGLEYAHLLARDPAAVGAPQRAALAAAGWEPEAAAILTEIVALVAFQARVVSGLRLAFGRGAAHLRQAA